MELITGPRGSGRTTKLVQWAAQDNARIIVVSSDQEVDCVYDRARTLDLEHKIVVLTWVQYIHIQMPAVLKPGMSIGIDNVDRVLENALGLPLGAMTITKDHDVNLAVSELLAIERNLA